MPANRVAGYIIEAYEKFGFPGFAVAQPRSDGGYSIRLAPPYHPNTLSIIDIKPTETGSSSLMYESSIFVLERDRAIVRYCAKGLF